MLSILNEISQHTFEYITTRICELEVGSSVELDKVVELVFEKATNDSNSAHLYATMCKALLDRDKPWSFLNYVHNKDNDTYFWIRDLAWNNLLAGPYTSVEECIQVTTCEEQPTMQSVETSVVVVELQVVNELLCKVRPELF